MQLWFRNSDRHQTLHPRSGVSPAEVLVALGVGCLLLSLLLPSLLQVRERARSGTCRSRLQFLTTALQSYHETYSTFPAAAAWDPHATQSLSLHLARRFDRITHENWALQLLPFLGETELVLTFHPELPIGDPVNQVVREEVMSSMVCHADSYNQVQNVYQFDAGIPATPPIRFARGNYALNGGSHNQDLESPSTVRPGGDSAHLVMQEEPRAFRLWGNGIAGFNKCFARDEFANGSSTFVVLEEVRAGIHPLDPRGVWSLGQIGGSITWAHGINGDACGPNNSWFRADDLLGCGQLHEAVGSEALTREKMPCVSYVDFNQQATARSQHAGGVHVAFLDGSVKFVADQVDPGLWHVMHSHETPAFIFSNRFIEASAGAINDESETVLASQSMPQTMSPLELPVMWNTLGMQFARLPSGEFTMGLPDLGHIEPAPPECPPHQVQISKPFWLGRHEVTRADFERVMAGSHPKASSAQGVSEGSTDLERYPVTGVTWDEAHEFCRTLTALPAERAARRSYRLPTEAEWEYACRAGERHSGTIPRKRRAEDRSEATDRAGLPLPLMPIGSFPANDWGLFDLSGNAWEWTADWFERDYYTRSPRRDPHGPPEGMIKVVRGGNWRFVGEPCHIDYAMLPPWKANPFVGFRVVCDTAPEAD